MDLSQRKTTAAGLLPHGSQAIDGTEIGDFLDITIKTFGAVFSGLSELATVFLTCLQDFEASPLHSLCSAAWTRKLCARLHGGASQNGS